jgi:predicted secreted hydrolase
MSGTLTRDVVTDRPSASRRLGMAGVMVLPFLLAAFTSAPVAGQAFTPTLDPEGFLRATTGRPVVLPGDHAAHPETRTEWWYFTGPLTDGAGGRYGFQATWFRRSLTARPAERASPLGARDVVMFHGALTDLSTGRLLFSEDASRAFGPWAGASSEALEVYVYDDALRGDGERARLVFDAGEAHLELDLALDQSVVLRHGVEPGLSLKGSEPGQASWYYTLPDIPVSGTLRVGDGATLAVDGRAWMDHEFGSSQLGAEQVGWDWFSVVLDDGTVLMAYGLRGVDGRPTPTSSGTVLVPGEPARHLRRDQFTIAPTSSWTSPHTKITYPSGWELRVPGIDLSLVVTPAFTDQELSTGSTGVVYWEGLCRFEGDRAGDAVSGEGYVELVGYGESIADRFAPGYR